VLPASTTGKPEFSGCLFLFGVGVGEQGEFEEAPIRYADVLRLDPSRTGVIGNLANVAESLRVRGSVAQAIRYYEFILSIQPDSAEVLNNLGAAYLAASRPECLTRKRPSSGLTVKQI
jgi:Tfp pilus assembly protein PilF